MRSHTKKRKRTTTSYSYAIYAICSESFCLVGTCICNSIKKKVCKQIARSITKTRLFKYTENLKPKTEHFQIKILMIFIISAQNIDCGYSLEPPRRGGSNEYPQSIFFSRNKKNNVYPYKPQFCYIKVGFKGVNII